MSKPIKEIGREMFSTNWRDGFFSTLERAERAREATEAPELGMITPIILLTPEERRELVQRVWWEAIGFATELGCGDPAKAEELDLDNFIKREQL